MRGMVNTQWRHDKKISTGNSRWGGENEAH